MFYQEFQTMWPHIVIIVSFRRQWSDCYR